MKKYVSQLGCTLMFSLIFMGCEQFIEVDLPGIEPRLVVNTLLEPGDTLKVFLTESISVLDEMDEWNGFTSVEGALVALIDEKGEKRSFAYKKQDPRLGLASYYYLTDYSLSGNESYWITAEHEGFESVEAQVVFPELVPIKDLKFLRLGASEFSPDFELVEFSLTFDDPSSTNFYEILASYYGPSSEYQNHFYSGDLYLEPVNPIYTQDNYYHPGVLFEDVLMPGPDSEFRFRANLPKNADLDVTFLFSQISPSYFLYEQTSGLQNSNRGDILSQPVLVYTNVENGLGILKARNKDERVLKVLFED